MNRRTISLEAFHAELRAQGVPREHVALRCPICKTVQSITSFARAGVDPETAEKCVGFSCVGRATGAGPHKKGSKPGKGCDWTLGGLFQLHELEVVTDDGEKHPRFEVATPEEARQLMAAHSAS